jgi:hypothetical protein
LHVIIAEAGAGGEAEALCEALFGEAVAIEWKVGTGGLEVHGLPEGAAFDIGVVEAT